MSAYTPGPWEIDATHGLTVGPCRVRVAAATTSKKQARAFADARLIAAAPDMLAALKHAHEALAWHDGLQFEMNGQTADAVISAAIAKAEGEI